MPVTSMLSSVPGRTVAPTLVTVEQVNAAFAAAAGGPLKGVLRYSEAPLVSRDVIGDPASCVFDAGLTEADGTLVKILGWYDNEWGYTEQRRNPMEPMTDRGPASSVLLYWLPLGAGGRSVRFNGRMFEALMARHEHRAVRDLYHSALEVHVGDDRFVVEMTPRVGRRGRRPRCRAGRPRRSQVARSLGRVPVRDSTLAHGRHPRH